MTPDNPTDAEKKTSVGDLLKEGRLRQRLAILECSKRTHISARYLEALEEERWDDLPSESHRLGFLRLYARFLGAPSEEIVGLYRQKRRQTAIAESRPRAGKKSGGHETPQPAPAGREWYPASLGQLSGLMVVILMAAWGIYHGIRGYWPDPPAAPLARPRPHPSPRLIAVQRQAASQKIRVHAEGDSWLRVVTNERLLFEGILPSGATKEWVGPGPFDLKIGDVKTLTVFWNDQSVDIQSGARGSINELRFPPAQ